MWASMCKILSELSREQWIQEYSTPEPTTDAKAFRD
jgi:hypothetical protein